ncbi:uncharacterized protein VTP21DRAFT_653 [Calcarisporiella thermophila]|uniref:uncharacterized protein n=1 Tax=Calcarisporiella thermophila TaxID=911321 RepID=UPI0037424D9B
MNQQIKKVIIAGGSGHFGHILTQELVRTGKYIVSILQRKNSTVDDRKKALLEMGVGCISTDYNNPDELLNAVREADIVISTLSDMAVMEQRKLLEACKDATVSRFIPAEFTTDVSALGGPFYGPKRDFRLMMKEYNDKYGMEYIFYINGPFMEDLVGMNPNFLIKEKKAIIVGNGNDSRMVATSMRDVARFVVASFDRPDMKNRQLTFWGDYMTLNEYLAKYETRFGKFDVEYISMEEAQKAINQENPFATVMEYFRVSIAKGDYDLPHNDNGLFPEIKPLSFEEFLECC